MRGLPWYVVLLLSLATWAVMLGAAWLATRFRGPRLTEDEVNARVTAARDDIAAVLGHVLDNEAGLAAVTSPGLAAEFTPAPAFDSGYAIGENPGGHVSLRDDDTTDEGDL